jgi:hypothetical protein
MLSIHVAKLAETAQERVDMRVLGLGPDHFRGRRPRTQDPDPVDLAGGLRAGNGGRHEGSEGEAADESAPIHQAGPFVSAANVAISGRARAMRTPVRCTAEFAAPIPGRRLDSRAVACHWRWRVIG